MNLDTYDLNLIRDRLLANFSVEELEQGGWLDRTPDAAVRKKLGELDMEFFCRFYLREHFFKPPAPMHKDLFSNIKSFIESPGRKSEVWALPRGFAKTTIGCLGIPTWCVVYKKRRHIPIISDSFDQAKDQLQTLKDEFENNDRIKEDFADFRGELWQQAEIETTNGVKIRALGSGMKIRGRKYGRFRPDLIILDDIENLKSVNIANAREQLRSWLKRSVMRAGWEDTKVLALGNFLHYECLLANLADNPMFSSRIYKALVSFPDRLDLWDEWRAVLVNLEDSDKEESARAFFEARKETMLEGAKSAWPEAFPVYDLMMIRVSEGEASFNMELQNDPRDPAKALFKSYGKFRREFRDGAEWLIPLSGRSAVKLRDCAIFGFTDPSMGRTITSDFSAIIIAAKAPTKQLFILEADIKRRPPDQIIADQIKWARQYPITRWGIESNQFQALFASDSAHASMEQDVYLPVTPVPQMRNKDARIQSLQPDLENRYILLPEHGQQLLKKQLEQFPSGYKDGPDALEGVRTIARKWQPVGAEEVVMGDVHQFGEQQSQIKNIAQGPWADADMAADQRIREHREQMRAEAEATLEGEALKRELAKYPIPKERQEIFTPITVL